MDSEFLVEERIDEGRKLVVDLRQSGFDVTVAFWVRTEEGRWYLYLGSAQATPEKLGECFRIVYLQIAKSGIRSITPMELKIVRLDDSRAIDAIAARDRFSSRRGIWYREDHLGNMPIDKAYIYPSELSPMNRKDVLQAMSAIMGESVTTVPPVVSLRDGSTIQAFPVGIEKLPRGDVQVLFHDAQTSKDYRVLADDVVSIQ